MKKTALSVRELSESLGVHRNTVYRAVQRGELRSVRIGKRLLIPTAEVERLAGKGDPAQGEGGAK